jgi:hypothetical protein
MARGPSKALPEDQEQFEALCIALICRQNPDLADVILEQWSSARILGRWGSGLGFFVDCEVADAARTLDIERGRELISYDLLVDVGSPMDSKIAAILGFDDAVRMMDTAMTELSHDGQRVHMLECVSFARSRAEWPTEKYNYRALQVQDGDQLDQQ